MKCVQIYKSGIMNELNLSKSKLSFSGLPKFLMKHSKSQGNGDIKELYKWLHNENIIKCFSWYDGEAGFENKHDLPPGGNSSFLDEDSSVKLLYGDIFLILFNKEKFIDFQVPDYSVFYNLIFEGFDNCETEAESEEEENIHSESDEDYVENIATDEEYEILSDESGDLEIDQNEY
tara:strand:+ start:852 stop:1379 length:528 start_codon:yes stop_codon:yes gene_type:complete